MPKQEDVTVVAEESEVTRLMALDTTPWYQKPNLRFLYFCLVPAALGVEMTTGYDGSVLNGLQAVAAWQDREFRLLFSTIVLQSLTLVRNRLRTPQGRTSRRH
jgi:hypothetical protein